MRLRYICSIFHIIFVIIASHHDEYYFLHNGCFILPIVDIVYILQSFGPVLIVVSIIFLSALLRKNVKPKTDRLCAADEGTKFDNVSSNFLY